MTNNNGSYNATNSNRDNKLSWRVAVVDEDAVDRLQAVHEAVRAGSGDLASHGHPDEGLAAEHLCRGPLIISLYDIS